jgi:hypothetical protein
VKVSDNAKALFRNKKAASVLHTAGSRIPKIYDQLIEHHRGGLNIVTSSEELLFHMKGSARHGQGGSTRSPTPGRSPSWGRAATRASSWTPCRSF